jgi:hypothetical protein
LGNEAGVNKLLVSFIYGAIQFGVGLLAIQFASKDFITQLTFALVIIFGLSLIYLVIKTYILKKYT